MGKSFSGDEAVGISVSSSSQNVKISDDGVLQVRVENEGTATAYIKFGSSSGLTVTTGAGIAISPGAIEVFSVKIHKGPVYAAAIAAGSTGRISFTKGAGI